MITRHALSSKQMTTSAWHFLVIHIWLVDFKLTFYYYCYFVLLGNARLVALDSHALLIWTVFKR